VREQLEHDRVIRLLQPRYKRRFTVGVNVGSDQTASVGTGDEAQYPDLVLTSAGSGRKLAGVVEVETGESVNQLEAMAQWARFGRLPVEFALYVPTANLSVARRLCADHHIGVTEIWTYHTVGDQMRFAQVFRAPIDEKLAAARAAAAEARRAGAGGPPRAAKPAGAKAASSRRKTAPARKPARKAAGPKKPKPAPKSAAKRASSKKR
jgi:hypothetical protein